MKLRVFADLAQSLADLSTCRRRRVGAVVVDPDLTEVLAIGYNGPPAGVDNGACRAVEGDCGCVHAEANAVAKLRDRRDGLTLVATMSPCEQCAGLIVNCRRISAVLYGSAYRDGAGAALLRICKIDVHPLPGTVRTVVVGERANRPGDGAKIDPATWAAEARQVPAFADGRSRAKLVSLGLDLGVVASVNLLPPAVQGTPWDAAAAGLVAAALDLRQFDVAYLAGARACAAFDVDYAVGREVGRRGSTRLVAVPHPSGLNRFWNDPRDVRKLKESLCRR